MGTGAGMGAGVGAGLGTGVGTGVGFCGAGAGAGGCVVQAETSSANKTTLARKPVTGEDALGQQIIMSEEWIQD